MDAFVSRENIRRFRAQLLASSDEARKSTLRKLLEDEKRHLHEILADKKVLVSGRVRESTYIRSLMEDHKGAATKE